MNEIEKLINYRNGHVRLSSSVISSFIIDDLQSGKFSNLYQYYLEARTPLVMKFFKYLARQKDLPEDLKDIVNKIIIMDSL